MADIDQIIAGGAGASSRADFSGLADIPEAFWKGRDRKFVQEGRDLFKDGVPKVIGPDGKPTDQIDYAAMRNALFKHGDIGQGVTVDNLDLARQQLKFGQQQSAGIQSFEGGAPPQAQPPIVSPPSPNRSAATPVAPPLNRGGVNNQAGDPNGMGGNTIMKILSAQGIPNDQLGAASATVARQLGVEDPTQPIDISDPRIRNVLVPAIQQLKRAGVGRVIPDGEPTPAPVELRSPSVRPAGPSPGPYTVAADGGLGPPAAAPQPAPPPAAPAPVTNAVTTPNAPQAPSRIDQAIAYYAGIMSHPMSPKQNVELAKTRLEALQKSNELTTEQKNYAQAVTQGFPGTMADYQAAVEGSKAYAAKSAESNVKKYDAIQESGQRAQVDMPQLQLAKTLMSDPNYMSGVGEKYNLIYKRLLAQFGDDPNTAVPQEAFRKIVSAGILDQIKAMAGTGPVRVAEMKIIKDAAASQDNSPQSNRLLVELHLRMQKRAADIADMAQRYNNGRLDAGFDRAVSEYDRKNPIISDKEIPDFRKIIGSGKKPEADAPAQFATPADVRAAVTAGKLKSGDAFTDATGRTRYVP